ncbi:hypothetical protein EMIT0P291_30025 [Pseudomonas sp. IT-P291]
MAARIPQSSIRRADTYDEFRLYPWRRQPQPHLRPVFAGIRFAAATRHGPQSPARRDPAEAQAGCRAASGQDRLRAVVPRSAAVRAGRGRRVGAPCRKAHRSQRRSSGVWHRSALSSAPWLRNAGAWPGRYRLRPSAGGIPRNVTFAAYGASIKATDRTLLPDTPVGASLLAMDVNDGEYCLNERGDLTSIASRLAPTRFRG